MLSSEMFINRVTSDNPWWITGRISDMYASAKSRLAIKEFYGYVTDNSFRRALLLIGPRRVGKTWLMQHVIRALLEEEVVGRNQILFFPIDNPVYNGMSLEDLLNGGARIANVDAKTDKLYVFFDEIQYLREWERHLKTLVDSYPNIRFVASGSAASVLSRGSLESGAGRIMDYLLPPLMFDEYLTLTGRDHMLSCKDFGNGLVVPHVEDIVSFNKTFVEYVNYGGYPELVFSEIERNMARQFVQRDIVDKVLLKDLPSLYKLRDLRELQSLFTYMVFHSGMQQSLDSLSSGSGVEKYSITQALNYLEDAFLISRLDRIDINAKKFQRAMQFKVYLTNPSLRAAMFQPVDMGQEQVLGHMVETTISAQFGIGHARDNLRYANWKTGKNQHEVDLVFMDSGEQRPISAAEIKWSDSCFEHPSELNGIVQFAQRHGLKRVIVTTRSQSGVKSVGEVEIVFVPAALYAIKVRRDSVARSR